MVPGRAVSVPDGRRVLAGNDKVGLAAAHNEKEVLVQVYNRDTGERIWDISAPIYIQGRHWGAFRIGYTM